MLTIHDDSEPKKLIKFWVGELTNFTPQQVEVVVEALEKREAQHSSAISKQSV